MLSTRRSHIPIIPFLRHWRDQPSLNFKILLARRLPVNLKSWYLEPMYLPRSSGGKVLAFVALLAIPVLAVLPGKGGQSARPAQTFSNIDLALQNMRQAMRISTGFERALGDTDIAVTLDLSRNEPGSVLDELIAQRPIYVWTLEGGVYCVYPRIRNESLAQLAVAKYVLRDANLRDATEGVFTLPELVKWRSDHRVGRLLDESYLTAPRGSPTNEPQRISITLSNVPLRAILSEIAYRFGKTQWTISHLQLPQQEAISLHF
jgi:hypothetical protein